MKKIFLSIALVAGSTFLGTPMAIASEAALAVSSEQQDFSPEQFKRDGLFRVLTYLAEACEELGEKVRQACPSLGLNQVGQSAEYACLSYCCELQKICWNLDIGLAVMDDPDLISQDVLADNPDLGTNPRNVACASYQQIISGPLTCQTQHRILDGRRPK
ncbi:MAG: hypothetical protein LBF84_03455 [Holosporales bacterium]|jgi:hypothetical protein|nr:hypothetical protein [Holosporales bacterium]